VSQAKSRRTSKNPLRHSHRISVARSAVFRSSTIFRVPNEALLVGPHHEPPAAPATLRLLGAPRFTERAGALALSWRVVRGCPGPITSTTPAVRAHSLGGHSGSSRRLRTWCRSGPAHESPSWSGIPPLARLITVHAGAGMNEEKVTQCRCR
jgi:hypothetical protein